MLRLRELYHHRYTTVGFLIVAGVFLSVRDFDWWAGFTVGLAVSAVTREAIEWYFTRSKGN